MHRWSGLVTNVILIVLIVMVFAVAGTSAQEKKVVPEHNEAQISPTGISDSAGISVSGTDTSNTGNPPKKLKKDAKKKPTEISDIGSFWELTKLGGKVRWGIFGVLIIGLALIVQKMVELFSEQRKSKKLLDEDISTISLDNITKKIDESKENDNSKQNMVTEIFDKLLNLYENTGQTSTFNTEISNFITFQQDRFETFNNRIAFLSDTAGALGLLGTVWGMFRTFFGGNLDKQVILDGMGVALITTLLGLVASIILNFFGTEIFSFFNKRLEELQRNAEKFRIKISQIEKRKQKKFETERKLLQQEAVAANTVTQDTTIIQAPRDIPGPPFKLVYISGDAQNALVNSRLDNPLVVELLDAREQSLPNQIVKFSIEKGDGSLANGGKIQEVMTDEVGHAITHLTTGIRAGENIVRTSARSLNGQYVEFMARSEPGQPEIMKLISGNNLAGTAGTELKEPFVVAIHDSFNNAIPNFQVMFKVSMGNGYFAGKTNRYNVITDANGLAQAYYTLGTKKGFNRIHVSTKKLRRLKLEIQTIGQ